MSRTRLQQLREKRDISKGGHGGETAEVGDSSGASPIRGEDLTTLVHALFYVPVEYAYVFPSLRKYTISQLREGIEFALGSPPVESMEFPRFSVPFSPEEDVCLMKWITVSSSGTRMEDYLEEFGHMLKAFRTEEEIEARIVQLREMSTEQRDAIITKFARQTIDEEMMIPPPPGVPALDMKDLDDTIDSLWGTLQGLESIFGHNELAMVVDDRVRIPIHKKWISIGTSDSRKKIDVELAYFVDGDRSFEGIEALLEFRDDGNFYVMNCGSKMFRINGVAVEPDNVGKVCNGAIWDFDGILFLFLINSKFVELLMSELKQFCEGHGSQP
jgi:hypothetical protein